VANLVADLREKYASRIVIFDLPPVLNTDDAIAVLPKMDCVLMVVGDGVSTSADIEESLRLVPDEKLLGVVLNKAEAASTQYY
jgi:Mrp family chromosome partitioning ATPase